MNRFDIEECNDIDVLRNLALEQHKLLFYIGEVLVDESKYHISAEQAIDTIREHMQRISGGKNGN